MKYLKLSKTGWLILGVGLFIVVMAGLGITRSQQSQEQGRLSDELAVSQESLAALQTSGLQSQLADLQKKAQEEQAKLEAAQGQMDQTVVSASVTDKLFSVARSCGVLVTNFSSSPVETSVYQGIDLSTTSLNVAVEGELPALIDFVESLNHDFTTGVVKAAQIDIPPVSSNETSKASIQMTIYSYEGNKNG